MIVLYVCAAFLVVLWLVVFFFKQKTAYEMRISDWSSDVCSSDLLELEHAHRPVPDDGAGLFQDAGQLLRGLRADVEDEVVVGHRVGRLDGIGSASCRESVCQYV